VDALYAASGEGVPVDLVVRGICALRPGVPDLSETVRVRSILGRFLEHSRVLWFANGGADEVWFGSADLMHRNLDRRIEAMVRVAPEVQRPLLEALELAMSDRVRAWHLDADGRWNPTAGDDLCDYQVELTRLHTAP
jgi:polyphosphate kinase